MPKKVMLVITKSNWGGAQRYVYNLATSLKQRGYRVTVVAGGEGPLAERVRASGISYQPLYNLGRDVNVISDIRSAFHLYRSIKQERPDILHVNSSKLGPIGAVLGKFSGVKRIIFTAHGLAFEENRGVIAKLAIKIIYFFTVVLCHLTIAVSDGIKEKLSAWGNASKILVIRNGVQRFDTRARPEAINSIARGSTRHTTVLADLHTIHIGTLAELHPIKGLSDAIRAIALLVKEKVPVSFTILGEGSERVTLEALIRENRLENNVFLAGFVPNGPECLSAFDIFTMTSHYEGLNFAVLEAGLQGLPVVATHVGGLAEVIEDNVNGILVPPKNPKAIAVALKRLIQNPSERTRLGTKLKETVTKQFLWDQTLEKTLALYEN